MAGNHRLAVPYCEKLMYITVTLCVALQGNQLNDLK